MNDSSHFFVTNGDEDARCIECDCRPGGRAAEKPCAVVIDYVPGCRHESTDCHQYINTQTGKASTAPTTRLLVTSRRGDMAECVELGYDRDTESFQYPEDVY